MWENVTFKESQKAEVEKATVIFPYVKKLTIEQELAETILNKFDLLILVFLPLFTVTMLFVIADSLMPNIWMIHTIKILIVSLIEIILYLVTLAIPVVTAAIVISNNRVKNFIKCFNVLFQAQRKHMRNTNQKELASL